MDFYIYKWHLGIVGCRQDGLSQPALDRVENGLETAGHVELLEDAVQMALDRLFADEKGLGDVFVRSPCREQTQDLLFPGGQRVLLPPAAVLSELGSGLLFHESGDHLPVDPQIPFVDRLNRLGEIGAARRE